MTDILIYVPKNKRDEQFSDRGDFFWEKVSSHEIDKNWEYYWSLSHTPKKIIKNKSKVTFTDGKNVLAEGIIIDFDDKNIYFKSLTKVNYLQPKQAPTRGFTYVK